MQFPERFGYDFRMRRLRLWVAIGCAVVPLALPTASLSARAATGETMIVAFGVLVDRPGVIFGKASSLNARGALSGPGTGLGGGPLKPIPNPFLHNQLPRITYTTFGLHGHTYSFTVKSGHELQSQSVKTLILDVQLDKSYPSCPGANSAKTGTLTMKFVQDGTPPVTVTLDGPCGIYEEWEGEASVGGLSVSLKGGTATASTGPASAPTTKTQDLTLTITFQGVSEKRDEKTDAQTPKQGVTANVQSGNTYSGTVSVAGSVPAGDSIYVVFGPTIVAVLGPGAGDFSGVTEPKGFGADTSLGAFVCKHGASVGQPVTSMTGCLAEGDDVSVQWAV